MNKRAIFVIGPESSGTRLATRLFTDIGFYGDYTHDQRLDREIMNGNELLKINENAIVFRRSVPHNGVWVDPVNIKQKLENNGYYTYTIITVRNFTTNCKSKVKNNHSPSNTTAVLDVEEQLAYIFKFLPKLIPFYILCTSALFKNPFHEIRDLFKWTQLFITDKKIEEITDTIYDADKKHRK